jgi:hypothetical protein
MQAALQEVRPVTEISPDGATVATRLLGVLGILGGLVLLAAFVVEIPAGWNNVRIIVFYVGTVAIAIAVHPRHALVSRRLALVGTVALVLANAWSLGWFLFGMTRERPSAGDFGLVGFYAALASWLADAWFGLVALRIRVLWMPATLALAVGALLAITGIDRLELTSEANPTIFGPLSLVGIALVGVAWVLLGTQIAMGRALPRVTAVDVPRQGVQA